MYPIRALVELSDPIAAETPAQVAHDRFRRQPHARVAAVVAEGRPVGAVGREALEAWATLAATAPALRDLPVSRLMRSPPAVVEASTDAEFFCRSDLATGAAALTHGCIVVEDGFYAGLVDPTALIGAAVQAADVRADEERERRGDLAAAAAGLRDEALALTELSCRRPSSSVERARCEALAQAARALDAVVVDAADGAAAEKCSPQPTSLQDLVDEIDSQWQARTDGLGRRLVMSCQAEFGLRVRVDRDGFKRLIDALLGAALADGGVVEAGVRADADDDRVRIEVTVRGAGRDPVPGEVGPGWAACRRLARALGGEVAVRANPGSGATFELRLVLDRATETAADVVSVEAEPDGPAPRVLIVDDNATNRMVAQALCDMFGFNSETACDGLEALEAARARDFDLVLMDIRMPNLDGVGATRAIRALGGAAGRTPIIALTANADPEAVRGYMAAGMCAVVEKPIKPERLLDAVTQALVAADEPARATHRGRLSG